MTIFHWVLLALGVYFACGVGMMFMLLQTPYQDNPLWVMVLLWPLYLWQGI